jgi:hypothetical protein
MEAQPGGQGKEKASFFRESSVQHPVGQPLPLFFLFFTLQLSQRGHHPPPQSPPSFLDSSAPTSGFSQTIPPVPVLSQAQVPGERQASGPTWKGCGPAMVPTRRQRLTEAHFHS